MGEDTARMLHRYGVVTMPAFTSDDARRRWSQRLWDAIDEFPEYRQGTAGRHTQRVLGGFGALGNPSSFHHTEVQELRMRLKKNVVGPMLAHYVRVRGWTDDHVNLESLFDRLCVRFKEFGSVSAETWHRDIYDGAKYGHRELPRSLPGNLRDLLFGGWVNMSDEDQFFVCEIGSHRGEEAQRAQDLGGGFAQVDKQRQEEAARELERQANRHIGVVRCNRKGHVVVPPGHIVMFPQNLLHAVLPGPGPTTPGLRLFLGHRLTCESVPLFPDLARVVTNNEVPHIPSGQRPPMYSQNHYAFFSTTSRYRDWGTSTFKQQCLFDRVTPSGVAYSTPGSRNDRDPDANRQRTMPSLSSMGFEPYGYTRLTVSALMPESIGTFQTSPRES